MIDITSAQIHLAVNHIPVLGVMLAAATLVVAAAMRRTRTRNLGLGLLVFTAVSALPTYFSGEGAEEIIENRSGVSEVLIERHEDAASVALAVTLAAGLIAAAALSAGRLRHDRAARVLSMIALLASLGASGLMAQVAHLGGQIRHDELRSQTSSGAAERPT